MTRHQPENRTTAAEKPTQPGARRPRLLRHAVAAVVLGIAAAVVPLAIGPVAAGPTAPPASVAPPTTASMATAVELAATPAAATPLTASPVVAARASRGSLWAYAKCIFGIGVPIGLAIGLAVFAPAVLKAMAEGSRGTPAGVLGRYAKAYGKKVYKNCRAAYIRF